MNPILSTIIASAVGSAIGCALASKARSASFPGARLMGMLAAFAVAGLLALLLVAFSGCTVRGGWPRFLRPGEASDSAIRKEAQQLAAAKDDLTKQIALRRIQVVDLYVVGQSLVSKYGRDYALKTVWDMWAASVKNEDYTRYSDVTWLQTQSPTVMDLAWLANFRDEWAK